MDWVERLGIPPACDAGRRAIPKTTLVKQGNLTALEEKKLKGIERLSLLATLQKSNTYMPPVSDEVYQVDAIIYLECILRSSAAPAEVAEVLHPLFPNPTVIFFERGDEVAVSAAIKRKSLAERGAMVVEEIQNTGLFNADEERYAAFVGEIRFERIPQSDLLAFVKAFAGRTRLCKAARTLGFYPKCADKDVVQFTGHLKKMEELQSQIRDLQEKRKNPETSLNESSKLRVEIKKLEKERDKQAEMIKELCHE